MLERSKRVFFLLHLTGIIVMASQQPTGIVRATLTEVVIQYITYIKSGSPLRLTHTVMTIDVIFPSSCGKKHPSPAGLASQPITRL